MSTLETKPRTQPHFLVGRDSRGQWVVRDQRASRGGLFKSRAEALQFAFRERGEAAGAVVLAPHVIELIDDPAASASAGNSTKGEAPILAEA